MATKLKKPTPVSHLLAEGTGMLRRLREGVAGADRTLAVVRQHLPQEIAAQVFGAAFNDGTLTVFVRSASWGTRLRYVVPECADRMAAELGAAVERVKVKVRAGRG